MSFDVEISKTIQSSGLNKIHKTAFVVSILDTLRLTTKYQYTVYQNAVADITFRGIIYADTLKCLRKNFKICMDTYEL